jgi:hypothetical protein
MCASMYTYRDSFSFFYWSVWEVSLNGSQVADGIADRRGETTVFFVANPPKISYIFLCAERLSKKETEMNINRFVPIKTCCGSLAIRLGEMERTVEAGTYTGRYGILWSNFKRLLRRNLERKTWIRSCPIHNRFRVTAFKFLVLTFLLLHKTEAVQRYLLYFPRLRNETKWRHSVKHIVTCMSDCRWDLDWWLD